MSLVFMAMEKVEWVDNVKKKELTGDLHCMQIDNFLKFIENIAGINSCSFVSSQYSHQILNILFFTFRLNYSCWIIKHKWKCHSHVSWTMHTTHKRLVIFIFKSQLPSTTMQPQQQ